jgi:hypothetical protein
MITTQRRYLVRRVAASTLVAAAIAFGLVRAFAGGFTQPPPDGAAAFVPRGALVYLNLHTDRGGGEWKRTTAALGKLPVFSQLRDLLVRQATTGTLGGLTFQRDVRPWLGDEAAFAELPEGKLLVLQPRKERAAQAALVRVSHSTERYRGLALHDLGGGDVAIVVGGYALLGQRAAVRAALDAAATKGASLASDKTYEDLRGGLPQSRVVTGYVSAQWIRAHLSGPAGLLSAAAQAPSIQAAAISFGAASKRLEVALRGRTGPGRSACTGQGDGSTMLATAPARPALFLGLENAQCLVRDLMALPRSGIGKALRTLAVAAQRSGINLGTQLLPLLKGDTALTITPGQAAPTFTLDVAGAKAAQGIGLLGRLQPVLAGLLSRDSQGEAPGFATSRVAGVNVLTAQLTPALQLSYAAFNGHLLLSNSVRGIAAVRNGHHLDDSSDFKTVLRDRPNHPSALVFLDLEKLLALADQAGLGSNPIYSAFRDDLQKIGAAGAVLTREGNDIDAELRLKNP